MSKPIEKRSLSQLGNIETQEPVSKKIKIESTVETRTEIVSQQVLGVNSPQISTISSQYGVKKMDVDRIDQLQSVVVIPSELSFTLLDLPEEMLVQIFIQVMQGEGGQQYSKLILVCQKIKRIVQGDVLSWFWDNLKKERLPRWLQLQVEELKRKNDFHLLYQLRGYTQFSTLINKIHESCNGKSNSFSCFFSEYSNFQRVEQAIEDANLMQFWNTFLLFIEQLTPKQREEFEKKVNTVFSVKKILAHEKIQRLYLRFVKELFLGHTDTESYIIKIIPHELEADPSTGKIQKLDEVKSEKPVKLQYILPREIQFFSNLHFLSLAGMHLVTLPNELGNLMSLTSLDCLDNDLDSLPPSLVNLTNLMSLKLNNNLFNSVPNEILMMTSLHGFYISENQICTIPDFIGHLTNLEELSLNDQVSNPSSNSLPSTIGMLTNLKMLDLSGWDLHTIPDWIGNLTALESLALCDNNLSFLPSCLTRCSELKGFDISGNKFTKIPHDVLSKLPKLEDFMISENQISSFENIHSLKKLKFVYINDNPIISIPAHLIKTELEGLAVDSHLLFISPEILEKKIRGLENVISIYNLEREYKSASALGQLYQAILHFYDEKKVHPKVKEAFERLELLFQHLILNVAQSVKDPSRLFDDPATFYLTVREIIRMGLKKLTVSDEEEEALSENFVAAADAVESKKFNRYSNVNIIKI